MLSKSEFKGLFDEHLNEEGKEKLWEVYEGLETHGVLLTSACVCRDQNGNVFTVYRCSSDTWSDGCDFYDEHGEPDNTDSAPIVKIIKTLTDQEILEFQRGAVSVGTTFQVGDWVSIHEPAEGSDLKNDPFVPGMEEQFDMVGQVVAIDGDGTLKVKVERQSKDFWWDPAYLSIVEFKIGDWVLIQRPSEPVDPEDDCFVSEMEEELDKVGKVVEFDHDGYYTVMTNEDEDRHYIWHPAYLSPAPEPASVSYSPQCTVKVHPEAGDWDKGIAESAYAHGLVYLGTLTSAAYWTHDEDLFVYMDGDWELTTDLRLPNKHYAYQERP